MINVSFLLLGWCIDKDFYEKILPGFLDKFENILTQTFFCSDSEPSIADFTVVNTLHIVMFPVCEVVADDDTTKKMLVAVLTGYPKLSALKQRIEAIPSVDAYIKSRPVLAHDNVLTLDGY